MTKEHRSQFFCTSKVNINIDHFKDHFFSNKIKLSYDLNLPWHFEENISYQAGVLGYAVNPFYNEENPINTLNRILKTKPFSIPFYTEMDHLTGVFTFWLYHINTQKLYLFPDNGSLLEAYFKKDGKDIYIASQIKLLKKLTDINIREEIQDSNGIKLTLNPVDYTVNKNIFKLIPNHFYSTDDQEQTRYFPYKPKKNISLEQGADILIDHCKNTVSLFNKNYQLAIPLTAGWDSKVLLACIKNLTPSVLFLTIMHPNENLNNIDVSTANALAKKANINHTIITYPKTTYDSIERTINSSLDEVQSKLLSSQIKHIYNDLLRQRLVLTGTAIETTKNYFVHLNGINENHLMTLADIGESKFIKEAFRKWLERSKESITKNNYKITDIFHWEQNIGAFVSRGCSERNLSKIQLLCPAYNCKYLISSLLGVKDSYRGKHLSQLFNLVIQKEWPELNKIPVNNTIKERIIRGMCRLNIYDTYRRTKLKLHI